MSAQTGEAAPSGPMSRKLGDRARFRLERWTKEPNPLWIRELRQAARLVRTPVILCVLAILVALLMASIGGISSIDTSPATTGVILFQVFFSLAYFLTTLVGPAVAANSIASEREGRTWEAVLLTGLRPAVVARGKFLAAYTAIGMYIVMLAPVGALPFLFGGVTATETIVAFAFLFLIAGLGVAFGLAMSSKMASLRAAIVVTVLLAGPVAGMVYGLLGGALSFAAHDVWPGVPEGTPVWLPTAYARAPFDLRYVVFLVILPLAATLLPAWFLYEVTVANLTSVTDDHSTGLKRWFLVAAPILTLAAAVPMAAVPSTSDRLPALIAGLCVLFIFLVLNVYLFQGDPLGPSRRVMIHWDREGASRFRRFLGPGIVKTSMLELLLGVSLLSLLAAVGLVVVPHGAAGRGNPIGTILTFTAYAVGYYTFVVGLGAFLRARASSPLLARVLLLAVNFVVAVGPWVVAAVAGVVALPGGGRGALVVASPSPFYVFVMLDELDRSSGSNPELIVAGVLFALLWGGLGLLFMGLANRRANLIIHNHEAALAETDRILADEDARAAQAQAAQAAQASEGAAPVIPQGEGEVAG
jgi:ABC-type transport system involved in multi-copper enzyme maturation permease subunit